MNLNRRTLLASAGLASAGLVGAGAVASGVARAQGQPVSRGVGAQVGPRTTLRVGCLTDLSGQFRASGGPLAVIAAKLAVNDFGVSARNFNVEILQGDHQNNAEIASGIVRDWFDKDGVDLIIEGDNSSVALAVSEIAKEKNKVFLCSGAGSSDLTGSACNANMVHWTYDTYMLSRSTGSALVRLGGQSWYFITPDYAFGRSLQRDCTNSLSAAGGRLLGAASFAFPSSISDFVPLLRQAQLSGAAVLGLCSSGNLAITMIRQAFDLGLTTKLTVAPLLLYVSDIHALGLQTAQGLVFSDSFYWDDNDRTRAFSSRLERLAPFVRAGMGQAGVYSSLLHYLKVGNKVGMVKMKADGLAAVAALKKVPANDDCFGTSTIRADGRCLHPSYLRQVKTPIESRYPWDYCRLISQLPAQDAFRPLDLGGCPLIKF